MLGGLLLHDHRHDRHDRRRTRNEHVRSIMRQPACEGVEPDIFFPSNDRHPVANQNAYNRAREYCDQCPIRDACLQFALDHEREYRTHIYGMFGGATPNERRRMLGAEPRECAYCGADIAEQRGQARYCDSQCQNRARRTQRREAS